MGNRFFEDRYPSWLSSTQVWGNKPGTGRWYKRRLSKTRRKWAKLYCCIDERAYRHMGNLLYWEGECNWKGW